MVRTRLFNLVLIFVMAFGALGLTTQKAEAVASTLFFSEYIEGSSYNKALEIYNGTGAAVDLTAENYEIRIYFNGNATVGKTVALTGTLASGDVYVVADSKADPVILAQADSSGTTNYFNGDDAIELVKDGVVIDSIGQVGFDPGSQWGADLISTADNTLRRLPDICQGDPDSSDAFDPAVEWEGFAQDTFDGLGSHTANCGVAVEPTEPKINEYSANTVGSDDVEYIEVIGDTDTDYSAYTLLEIEGDGSGSGYIDGVFSVGTTGSNGFYLAGLANGDLENGSVSLLLVKNFTGAEGNDIDTDNDGVIDFAPWDEIADSVAISDGGSSDHHYGTPVLYPYYDGFAYGPGGASRIPDGYDTESVTDWVRNDFDLGGIPGFTGSLADGEAYNTPGAPNMIYVSPEMCGDAYTPIYEIQGSGMESPLVGSEVATEGIVVGDFQEGGKNGVYIQTITGDGDPTTSDGVFVYAPGIEELYTGDYVRVRGIVKEYNGLTEIGSVSQVWVCAIEQELPEPTVVTLPVNGLSDYEAFEGMRVIFPQSLVISEYFNFDRYGEIMLTSTRHLTPTAEFEPGSPEALAAAQAYLLDSITLDDGRTNQNPDPAIHPNGYIFDLNNLFRGGDLVTNMIGVMDYSYDLYRLQPTHYGDYTPVNSRTTAPEIADGDLKIASLNVLNYFTTIDAGTGSWICSPSGDMECRGADNADELARQRAKIISALVGLDADVIGLIEIENDRPGMTPDYAVADLVAGINELLGAGTYDYVPTGAIGTDAIKTALIYKPAAVTPIGSPAVLDSTFDPLFLDTYNRPVLAMTFIDNFSEQAFTVAVNHLKSKGSSCADIGDPDLGGSVGGCNLTRTNAAMVEVDWLATDPTGTGVDNFILIGDFNAYDKEDPIDAIKAGADDIPGTADDFVDMLFEMQGESAYSYVYDGQIGYLDYALANLNFAQFINDTNTWHINADEPDIIDYDTSFKQDAQDAIYAPDAYRASDHDPVIVSFTFDYTIVDVDIKPGSCENPFNVRIKGVLPVAILGSAAFDVIQIDPATVVLAGVPASHWSFEDVSSGMDCAVGGDGYLDLVLQFDAETLLAVIGEVADGDMATLKLVGYLFPDYGGTPVIGFDNVMMQVKGK
jgi:predicted extracellular nuclease